MKFQYSNGVPFQYSLVNEVGIYMSDDQIHAINNNRDRIPDIIESMDEVHSSDVYSAWPKMDDNSRRDLITKAMDSMASWHWNELPSLYTSEETQRFGSR